MNSITEFKREFPRVMRGYHPDEVDAAVDMLVSYGAELESANAEFAEVNDQITAQNDALAAENERLAGELVAAKTELAAFREKLGDAKDMLAEARRAADQLVAEAEAEAEQIRAARLAELEQDVRSYTASAAAEQKRYAALCRQVKTLTEAVRALYAEHMAALDAVAESMGVDVPAALPADEPAEPTFVPPLKKAAPPRVRRAAMAAAAIEPDTVELPSRTTARRPEPTFAPEPKQPEPEPEPEPVEAPAVSEAPIAQVSLQPEEAHTDGVNLSAVYRTASPTALKITREKAPSAAASSHSFAAVRRSLEEIGARLDQE